MFDARWGDDPRDADPRDQEPQPGWKGPAARDRDDTRSLGRGGGSERQNADEHSHDARHDAGWTDREREGHGLEREPGDVFTRHVDLPRGPERERVWDRDRAYSLRGSESRTLATVGAFRVVASSDLRDRDGSPADVRSGDLRHLREQGLIETARVPGYRDHAVALTKAGHGLLERHRDPDPERRQTFHSGLVRSREREHDLQVYRAYERAEERLRGRGAQVERVVLDHELKSEYQRWLHEHDKERDDYDGHPDRTQEEIQEWAAEHDLPYFDDEVHFPDVRIEYVEPDGRWDREDIEVITPHYRGAHGASVARAGFSTYSGMSLRISGSGGGGRGHRGGRACGPGVVHVSAAGVRRGPAAACESRTGTRQALPTELCPLLSAHTDAPASSIRERRRASRLPSVPSALRGLDPRHALPLVWQLSERRRSRAACRIASRVSRTTSRAGWHRNRAHVRRM